MLTVTVLDVLFLSFWSGVGFGFGVAGAAAIITPIYRQITRYFS